MGFTAYHNALLVLLLNSVASAYSDVAVSAETEIRDLRIGLTPGRTRVVFDLSKPTYSSLATLENPPRVVIDIPASRSELDLRNLPLEGTGIAEIRSELQPDSSLRYEFYITQTTHPKLFALGPNQAAGHRLVLDLQVKNESGDTPLISSPAQLQRVGRTVGNADDERPKSISQAGNQDKPETAANDGLGEWSGYASLQPRIFFRNTEYSGQDNQNISAAFEAEYFVDWAEGAQQFVFKPFYRYDANDNKRTHADIRELYWSLKHHQFLFKAGLDVVFWGVAESRHLVDIINQTDLVEDIDGEEKLGQPMINLDYMNNWGTWQLFVMPYFRERTYPGKHGRLRTNPVVDANNSEYDSSSEEYHIDLALRWSHNIGDWDIGLAHFSGTGREPWLFLGESRAKPAYIPYYALIEQTSLDAQATLGAWLWKLEAIYNSNDIDDYYAYAGGFEYTQFAVAGGTADLGWLMEYNYDQRGELATTVLQKDIFFGLRWSGNDINSTELLAAISVDVDNQSTFGSIEASRRLGESWTVELELRLFSNIDQDDFLYYYRKDDYLEVQITRHF